MVRTSLRWLLLSPLALPAPALADVVEPGFVETCTLERVQAEHAGQTCIACGTYHAEATRCDDELREGGYTQVCRSRGASVWTQIGCRDGAPPATTEPAPTPPVTTEPAPAPTPPSPAPAPAAESSGSTCNAIALPASGPAAWLVLGAALALARRRARR